MRFFVMERAKVGTVLDPKEFAKIGAEDLKYKRRLEKEGKIVGGPCLDILADGYTLETKTIEEMGEIFFNSPTNFVVERGASARKLQRQPGRNDRAKERQVSAAVPRDSTLRPRR